MVRWTPGPSWAQCGAWIGPPALGSPPEESLSPQHCLSQWYFGVGLLAFHQGKGAPHLWSTARQGFAQQECAPAWRRRSQWELRSRTSLPSLGVGATTPPQSSSKSLLCHAVPIPLSRNQGRSLPNDASVCSEAGELPASWEEVPCLGWSFSAAPRIFLQAALACWVKQILWRLAGRHLFERLEFPRDSGKSQLPFRALESK